MPAVPIIDTHLHLWDPARLDYPWLSEAPAIAGPHRIDDYRNATRSLIVEQMVFVQCECDRRQFRDEIAWISKTAQHEPRITGIVAWAPLENGDRVRDPIERMLTDPLVKGIRRIIQFEPDPDAFTRRSDFIRGVQLLADYNLSFDICIQHAQMPAVIELVHQCPSNRFVLDHLGKPDIKARSLDPWRNHLKTLAAFDNVWCKVSGLVTEADHANWQEDDLRPYIEHAVECFGFGRLLFGGDWPVATLASTYVRWIETLDRVVAGASDTEKRRLYHDTAAECYHLPGSSRASQSSNENRA